MSEDSGGEPSETVDERALASGVPNCRIWISCMARASDTRNPVIEDLVQEAYAKAFAGPSIPRRQPTSRRGSTGS